MRFSRLLSFERTSFLKQNGEENIIIKKGMKNDTDEFFISTLSNIFTNIPLDQ